MDLKIVYSNRSRKTRSKTFRFSSSILARIWYDGLNDWFVFQKNVQIWIEIEEIRRKDIRDRLNGGEEEEKKSDNDQEHGIEDSKI